MRQTKIAIILLACGLFAASLAFSPLVTAPTRATSLGLPSALRLAAVPPPPTLCGCYFSADCKGRGFTTDVACVAEREVRLVLETHTEI